MRRGSRAVVAILRGPSWVSVLVGNRTARRPHCSACGGLPKPLGVHATYLVRDGFVLELIDYSQREVHAGPERVMDQVGLTHISFSVSDLPGVLAKVADFGGTVV